MEPADSPLAPSLMATPPDPASSPIPRTFLQYLFAMGPGIVVVLTWLGAGDIVDASVAGASYGYALMWSLAIALIVRWVFVSGIARYQLCNPQGESVLEGLGRLHRLYPPFICIGALVLAHAVGVYMYLGLGESCSALARAAGAGSGGPAAGWAVAWAIAFYLLVARPVFRRIEFVFLLFLGILSVSLIGGALWVHPSARGILVGTIGFRMPPQRGDFNALLVVTSLMGAVAGSLANLMYPYFIREKGWTTPAHLRVQRYDLALGILVIIVLDLSVWVLGAEVLHPKGLTVTDIHSLARLLTQVIGPWGGIMIYVGVFAAVGSSIVGNALAYSYMATDAYLLWRRPDARADPTAYRQHPGYRWLTIWCLFSPLPWLLLGNNQFVALTVLINSFQVVLLPVLAIGVWCLTTRVRFIGARYRNSVVENLAMAFFCLLAVTATVGALHSLQGTLAGR